MLMSVSERERAQTASQGPEARDKLIERGGTAETARMLAWKQLFIQRVRNSSLVERDRVDDERA